MDSDFSLGQWYLNIDLKNRGRQSGKSQKLSVQHQARWWEGSCLRISIAVTKHHDQKASWGGKGLFVLLFHSHSSSLKEVRTATQTGQEPGGRSSCRDHGGCCLRACSTLFIEPRMVLPTMGRALPHQSLIMKIPYRFACSPILWMHFLNWGSLFSDFYSLFQVDMKLATTCQKHTPWKSLPLQQRTLGKLDALWTPTPHLAQK